MHQRITSSSFFIGRGSSELTASGDDSLISFGSGQPDLPPPPEVFEALRQFDGFKYGLVQGNEDLRDVISHDYPGARLHDFVITNGASEAIDLTLRALAEPGATVLLPRPYYYSYPHNVRLAGMRAAFYDLDERGKIDLNVFERELKNSTCKAVLVNSPSNPTGTVQEVETLHTIERLCDERGVYIISDEVYKDLIYVRQNYLMQGKHVITVNSFSKSYAMCGYRVGYAYSQDIDLMQKIVDIKNHTAMNTSTVGQAAALAAVKARQPYVGERLQVWRERRDRICKGMRELGLDLYEPEGAFYAFPKMKNATQAMHDLYYEHKIITYTGEWFGAPDRLRFSYALTTEKIDEGLRRLKKYLNSVV